MKRKMKPGSKVVFVKNWAFKVKRKMKSVAAWTVREKLICQSEVKNKICGVWGRVCSRIYTTLIFLKWSEKWNQSKYSRICEKFIFEIKQNICEVVSLFKHQFQSTDRAKITFMRGSWVSSKINFSKWNELNEICAARFIEFEKLISQSEARNEIRRRVSSLSWVSEK